MAFSDFTVLINTRTAILSDSALPCGAYFRRLNRTGVIFFCKARTRHRLWAVGVILGVAIAGTNLLPITVIALIAVVGLTQIGLDLYQGKPAPSRIEGSV